MEHLKAKEFLKILVVKIVVWIRQLWKGLLMSILRPFW